jgi:D-3-phosphoglycerate dehydrogenase
MNENWKILLPEQIDPSGPNSISDIADFESIDRYGTTPDNLIPHVGKYDGIILRGAEISIEVIDAATNLKVIAKHGTGLDNVDVDSATGRGIIVCNTPNANSRSVAEMVITYLFALRRNIIHADTAVRTGNWSQRSDWTAFCNHDVENQTIGLYGFGAVGEVTAELAQGIGMDCAAYDPYLSDDQFPGDVARVPAKDALFDVADVVSIHTPLTDETMHSVGLDELRKIDYIINTARGGVIDEDELRTVLERGELVGAGLDVLEDEPPAKDHVLLNRDDIIFSPHIGGQSVESVRNMSQEAAKNVRTVYSGEIPKSAVNDVEVTRS